MLPVEQFVTLLKSEGAAKRTIAFYLNPVRKFAIHCGNKPLDQVTADDVYHSRDQVIASDYHRHNHVRALKYFLRRNGVKLEIKLPSFTPPAPDEYQPDQLKKLFAAANPREKRLFSFYLMTGCREQEVQHMTWNCLSTTDITVRAHPEWNWNPKKFKSRVVPIPDALSQLMEPARSTGIDLIFPNMYLRPDGHHLKKLQLLGTRSGQDGSEFNLQRFRRTFATTHLRGGATIHEVASFLGHQDLNTIMRYLSLANAKSARIRSLANSAFGGL